MVLRIVSKSLTLFVIKKSDDSKENSVDSLVKEQVSEDTSSFVESSLNVDKETVFLVDKKKEFSKSKNHEKPVKKSVSHAEMLIVNTIKGKGWPKAVNTARPNSTVVNAVRVNQANVVKASACWGKPQQDDTGFIDSGCSRHMTGNIAYLLDFKEFDGGYVTFGGGAHGGRISGKGTLKTDSLDFEDDNMYSFDMKNIVPKESLTCLVAKATSDESMLWHRRLGHINFKNINKLVKDNLGFSANPNSSIAAVVGRRCFVVQVIKTAGFRILDEYGCVPTLLDQTMIRTQCTVRVLLFFRSNDNTVVVTLDTDNFLKSSMFGSWFTWVFFLTTKDETSEILKNFIKEIENLVDKKVKIIKSDKGTKFKNKDIDDFFREKGIKREYSVARNPQQNGVAERRNRTLIEAARTMLADSKLPTTFWAEAVSTACYVQNRVLVVKPHNKTPYELFRGFKLALSFMRPFGCHVTILNTLDNLGKFDGKSDEVAAGTIINESVGTQGELNAGTSEEISQECIMMPIWKYASYFDSPSKDVDNGKPTSAADDQKQDGYGPDNENAEQDKFEDDSSSKDVNAAGQHVNTVSPEVNTVDLSVNTASSYDQDSPKDMFTMGASHTLEA
ncbi:putative ribonuclease H-like domain-containing protein, partial [Tanacetum coccineum]